MTAREGSSPLSNFWLLTSNLTIDATSGVSDGDRTRNHRSHSPVLYH